MKRGLKFVALLLAVNIFLISLVSGYGNVALGGTPSFQLISDNSCGAIGGEGGGYFGYGSLLQVTSKLNDDSIDDPAVGRNAYDFTYDAIINFASPSNINKIETFYRAVTYPTPDDLEIYVDTGGGWNKVASFNTYALYGDSIGDLPPKKFEVNGAWSNVQRVKVRTDGNHLFEFTGAWLCSAGYIFELRAWGFYCGDGTCDIGEDNANCLADCSVSCPPETDAEFCSRLEKECGSVTADDNCGVSRTINCGDCGSGETCQEGICILPGEVYWSNLQGNPITQSSIGSTVWMIYKNKAGERYDFNVIEKDPINDDDIRTIPASDNFDYIPDLGAAWIISQEDFNKGADTGELIDGKEEFRFIVDGITSEQLIVNAGNYNNTPPTTQITNPKYQEVYVINKTLNRTTNIYFNQISSDPDDDLKLTWNFGDGTGQFFENIKKTGLGDTSHVYTTPGTKSIKLTAEEMSPPRAASEVQSASDATEIYVYGEGVIVFAIITKPNPSVMQEIDSRFVEVNASATHIVNCSYTLAECTASKPPTSSCYVVNDTITKEGIWCYKFPLTEQNKIVMEWTFDNDVSNKLIGYYGADYSKVVEFIKVFDEPGKHTLNLRASYTTP